MRIVAGGFAATRTVCLMAGCGAGFGTAWRSPLSALNVKRPNAPAPAIPIPNAQREFGCVTDERVWRARSKTGLLPVAVIDITSLRISACAVADPANRAAGYVYD